MHVVNRSDRQNCSVSVRRLSTESGHQERKDWDMITGWVSKLFGGSAGRARSSHTGSTRRNTAKRSNVRNAQRGSRFRSVSIRSTGTMCPAAKRTAGQLFLASAAPQLPLGGCTSKETCRCKYKYYTDRRQDTRRDQDAGLPRRPYHSDDRRYRRDRRKSTAQNTSF